MPATTPNPGLRYWYPLAKTDPQRLATDVCVYGATACGVAAAVQVARMGRSVVLLCFGRHLGGLTSGGLGATDIGNKAAIGGLAREFYRRLGKHYGKEESWTFEPGVAEAAFEALVAEHRITVRYESRLAAITRVEGRIASLSTEDGSVYSAAMFIDASYEGDLMAKAGVSYHVGREANATYGETLNGVHFGHPSHNFNRPVDPYVIPGKPESGLCRGISADPPGEQGQGDHRVQAYNFRMCMTDRADIRRPVPKPADYDPARYELLRRYIAAGVWDALNLTKLMPNGKTDTNNYGGFSSDNIGANYRWPDGSYAERERIFQDHVSYLQGMWWFAQNDPALPEAVRASANTWALAGDEFPETGGWPHELYVREARRMVSAVVMTEHHCTHRDTVDDVVGLAAYQMDSHNCQRVVRDGLVRNEGNVEVGGGKPYGISYRAIVPHRGECANLLVPWCLSASHIAFGSIRMEPVGMVMGQSAATAACLAIAAGVAVQDVDYPSLRARLLADGQALTWDGTSTSEGNPPGRWTAATGKAAH